MKSITFGRTFSEAIFISISQQHAKFFQAAICIAFCCVFFFHGFERRHLYSLWSVYQLSRPIIAFAQSYLSRPGFEPGLLRPQRSVLTTRRSGRQKLAMKSISFERTFSEMIFLSISQQHAKFFRTAVCTAFLLCNFFHGFERRHLYLLWSVYLRCLPIISFAESYLFRPGFETG